MVKVISDSTCDLTPEICERYDVSILPLYVRLGDKEFLDGVTITPDEIYEWSDATKETPKTAAPSVADAMNLFEQELKTADEIVCFTISQTMSASFNNCRLAAEELEMEDRIHVIDSENLSTGIGHLVIRASEMAKEGKTAAEIEEEVLRLRPLIRSSFMVDTLVYLHRGGRCSGLAAMVGGALKLHPRIAVVDGVMHPGKKYRGVAKKYMPEYVKDMEADLLKANPRRVFITHTATPEVIALVKDYLESLGVFQEILVTHTGSVVACHCGPGTLGVLYMAGES